VITSLVLQVVIFFLVGYMLRGVWYHIKWHTSMVAKPVWGAFYGSNALYEKMKYHWPYYKFSLVALVSYGITVSMQMSVLVLVWLGVSDNPVFYMVMPMESLQLLIVGFAGIFIFIVPERRQVFTKLCPCLVPMPGSSREPVLAIRSEQVESAVAAEQEFQQELAAVGLVSGSFDSHYISSELLSQLGEISNMQSPRSPDSPEPWSPRAPPEEEDVIDGSLLVNPIFGQSRDRSESQIPLEQGELDTSPSQAGQVGEDAALLA